MEEILNEMMKDGDDIKALIIDLEDAYKAKMLPTLAPLAAVMKDIKAALAGLSETVKAPPPPASPAA